jgi:hypothetical protein
MSIYCKQYEGELSRDLFRIIANEVQVPILTFYKKYLEQSIGITNSMLKVSLLSEKNLQSFFYKENFQPPQYFTISRFYDVNRISLLIERPIVLTAKKENQIIYDNRYTWHTFSNAKCRPLFLTIFFTEYRNVFTIETSGTWPTDKPCIPFKHHISYYINFTDDEYMKHILKHFHISIITSKPGIKGFCEDLDTYETVAPLSKCVIFKVFSYQNIFCVRSSKLTNPNNCVFTTVGVINQHINEKCIILLNQDMKTAYELSKDLTLKILALDVKHSKQFKANIKTLDLPPSMHVPATKQSLKVYESQPLCKCEGCCVAYNNWGDKMPIAGPQKKIKFELTLLQFCDIFNLQQYKQNILEVYNLCINSMDIETIAIHPEALPIYNIKHKNKVSYEAEQYSNITLCHQRPLVFGHCSFFEQDTKFYWAREEKDLIPAVEKYIHNLFHIQKETLKMKEKLLLPIFKYLQIFKHHHLTFCEKYVPFAEALRSWDSSLWGMMYNKLIKLLSTTIIYTYNGSNFDMVLLSNLFALVEMKIPKLEKIKYNYKTESIDYTTCMTKISLNISKRGNSITSLGFKSTCIKFLDAIKYATQNVSLSKLCEMLQLPMAKGCFPFDAMTTPNFLDEASLPTDPKQWENRLGKKPSKLEIQNAYKVFRDNKMTCISDYLLFYLNLDVKILLEAVVKLFNTFYSVLDLHPIDINKNTLSSYAYNSVLYYLAKQKKTTPYSVSNPIIYEHLNRGLIGGITVVAATEAGYGEDCNNVGINSHLVDNPVLPQCVNYQGE